MFNVKGFKGSNTIIYSTLEIIATIITIGVLFIWRNQSHKNFILEAFCNWTTLFIPLAAIWIYLFIVNKGAITKMLNNKVFVWIGNISPYLFLIHYVVIQYISYLLEFYNNELLGWEKNVLVLLELVISVVFSILYRIIENKYMQFKVGYLKMLR